MKHRHHRILLACALGMAALLCACAGVQTEPAPAADPLAGDKAALLERAEAYWVLRIDKNLIELYEYEAPAYREKVDLQLYITAFGGSAETDCVVEGPVAIEDDIGTVVVRVGSFFPGLGSQAKPSKDYWQRVDGQWYHLRRPPRGAR